MESQDEGQAIWEPYDTNLLWACSVDILLAGLQWISLGPPEPQTGVQIPAGPLDFFKLNLV